MDKTVTKNQKFKCLECENEITVDMSLKQGDFLECEFCGIEYEIVNKAENEAEVKIVEEEK
jgi:transcription elongation factor Elf1